MSGDLALQRKHIAFQDSSLQEFSDQNKSLYTQNYQNYQTWAADVNKSRKKLLFEINIVGQPKFPLRILKQ